VIGSFFIRGNELFLDLRSFERAIKAIPFFDKHIGESVARITDAAVVNRFFDAQEQFPPPNLDLFFNRSQEKQHQLEVEKFPVHFYEDGMGSLELVLRIRHIVAFEHWKGNDKYTLFDAIKSAIPG